MSSLQNPVSYFVAKVINLMIPLRTGNM